MKADYSSAQLNLFDESTQGSLSGRTCREHCHQAGEMILESCSKKSSKSPFLYLATGARQEWLTVASVKWHGDNSTLNIGECPNVVKESFLSQILQDDVPPKYFLSARACQGILRRAKTHGKILPPELKTVLIAQSTTTTGKTAESIA